MGRALSLTLACSWVAVMAGCAVDDSDFAEPSTPAVPFDALPAPETPPSETPTNLGEACRTVDDCAASEHCVKGASRFPVCVTLDDPRMVAPRGPKGQPPPPRGLIDGAPGFAGRGAGAPR